MHCHDETARIFVPERPGLRTCLLILLHITIASYQHCHLFISCDKLSQKRNAKVVNYDNSICCASFFGWVYVHHFQKVIKALHFQKSFKCDHFLFSFGLVYHTAQNTTLSCSLVKIQESMENKLSISAISQTLIF